jgi:hypothetical protein
MAKLYFYYASMNAGKSTTLLLADFNYRERGMETMLWTVKIGDHLRRVAMKHLFTKAWLICGTLDAEHPENGAALATLWPLGKFPLLVDEGVPIMESSIIVEHVAPDMIPADPQAAREVRLLDRFFDNYVMTPMQKVVGDALRPSDARCVEEARPYRAFFPLGALAPIS